MPFTATCTNTLARQISCTPTQADGVTPANVDPSNPVRVVALDGSPVSSAPDPDDPTNPLRCVVFAPDGYNGTSSVKVILDADMGTDTREISDPGVITFHDPEAKNVGTSVGAEVAKPV